jgi:hypothetical protein
VAFLLQAAIGGLLADFNMLQLSDQVFRLLVSYREVGFFIYQLQHFNCDSFEVYFNLWNNGGAHWEKEFQQYQIEENDSWKTVSKKKLSFADVVKKAPLTGANSVSINQQKE